MSEQMYLIRKRGGYYRPNAEGYTLNKNEAGRYTLAQAISHSHPNGPDGPRDGIDYVPAPPLATPQPAEARGMVEALQVAWDGIPTLPPILFSEDEAAALSATLSPQAGGGDEASENLGGWLSAAMDDPKVCAAMKADIQAWFDAGCPPASPPAPADNAGLVEELRGLIEQAEQDAIDDANAAIESGERTDLWQYDIEVSLDLAKRILSALRANGAEREGSAYLYQYEDQEGLFLNLYGYEVSLDRLPEATQSALLADRRLNPVLRAKAAKLDASTAVHLQPASAPEAWGDMECSGCTLSRRDCECN